MARIRKDLEQYSYANKLARTQVTSEGGLLQKSDKHLGVVKLDTFFVRIYILMCLFTHDSLLVWRCLD